jgi:hypothetical protein
MQVEESFAIGYHRGVLVIDPGRSANSRVRSKPCEGTRGHGCPRSRADRESGAPFDRAKFCMFTGIVEETGVVRAITPTKDSIRLTVEARSCARGIRVGDSLAVNGCCLTLVKIRGRGQRKQLEFDLLRETWERTTFSSRSLARS